MRTLLGLLGLLLLVGTLVAPPAAAQDESPVLSLRVPAEYQETIEDEPASFTWTGFVEQLRLHVEPDSAWRTFDEKRRVALVVVDLQSGELRGRATFPAFGVPVAASGADSVGGHAVPADGRAGLAAVVEGWLPAGEFRPGSFVTREATYRPDQLPEEGCSPAAPPARALCVYPRLVRDELRKASAVRPLLVLPAEDGPEPSPQR